VEKQLSYLIENRFEVHDRYTFSAIKDSNGNPNPTL